MNIVDILDLAIKRHETGTAENAYIISHNGKTLLKQNYMSNNEWKSFLAAISSTARNEYEAGSGDELSEKNGRPPKMASYGSSSRMIYTLSSAQAAFHYEKQLPTTIGGKAHLDGFYEDEKHYIFVEAKCHEIYSKKAEPISHAYSKLYEYINQRTAGNLSISMSPSKKEHYMDVAFEVNGKELKRFDIKQMICHLLGVATAFLKGSFTIKKTDFVYLLYDPSHLDISEDAKAEINSIYQQTCRECNLIDFAELYRAILQFLAAKTYQNVPSSDIDKLVDLFSFTLSSQKTYQALIK